jgi:cation diffusion facilitator family transporter
VNPGALLNNEDLNRLKQQTARLSVISNTALVVLKFTVGFASGSVSIVSEAIHTSMDLVAAVIAFFSVRKSSEPPDDVHAFGHGKFEVISGLVEALLIFAAAILIIREALEKLTGHGVDEMQGQFLMLGILVMGVSAIVNWLVSGRLMKVAHQAQSIALESDAWHLRTDVYTSLGVFIGLVLIRITGLTFLDPLFAIAVAVIIMKAAFDLTKRAYSDLIDSRLTDEEEDRIRHIICEHEAEYINFHSLRTRRAGPDLFIEFHLCFPGKVSVEQSHDFTDHLESDLKLEFPRASVTIHVEPCDSACENCTSFCHVRTGKGTG